MVRMVLQNLQITNCIFVCIEYIGLEYICIHGQTSFIEELLKRREVNDMYGRPKFFILFIYLNL